MALAHLREGLEPSQGLGSASESLLRRAREGFQLAEIRDSPRAEIR